MNKSKPVFDICIIGSGAGAAPVAYELVNAGYQVCMLEKGGFYRETDFFKDEMLVRKNRFQSRAPDELHIIEPPQEDGSFSAQSTSQFWGGNIVGGASNFMSGYFHRLKPVDFRLLDEFGPIEGANIANWPIRYEDLEPYYTRVEQTIGVSGKVVAHPFLEPRSTRDYPFSPTLEHPIAAHFDQVTQKMGLHPLPMARAILSTPWQGRQSCEYSGFCGSYGCHSGAKGSARAALLQGLVGKKNFHLITHAKAYQINTDNKGRARSVDYYDHNGQSQRVLARFFDIACYAIESARLLLLSKGGKHPHGIGNRYHQIGKNLHCCAGGTGHGIFDVAQLTPQQAQAFKQRGPFWNRALQDWYIIEDKKIFGKRVKGGTIDFVFDPPAPAMRANNLKWDENNNLGSALKQRLKNDFTQKLDFKFEVFCDWLPNDNCFVDLASDIRDKWGSPVARVRVGYHPHDLQVGRYLVQRGKEVMKAMGAREVHGAAFSEPTSNLIAGGLRFGRDPKSSALNPDCQIHDCENVFVTDGSFMPNGGSVTPTFTIYANAFRVADILKKRLA